LSCERVHTKQMRQPKMLAYPLLRIPNQILPAGSKTLVLPT
jgi:hypothetical protein